MDIYSVICIVNKLYSFCVQVVLSHNSLLVNYVICVHVDILWHNISRNKEYFL